MRPRVLGGILLAVLLVPAQVAAWTQPGGDASRSDAAPLRAGPLDILDSRPFPGGAKPSTFYGMGAIATPEGLAAVLMTPDQAGCDLVFFADPLGPPVRTHPIAECDRGLLVGYDPPTRGLLVCHFGAGTQPLLESRDARDGTQRWVLRGPDLAPTAPSTNHQCESAALDPVTREAFLPVRFCCTTVTNLLVIVDLDTGAVQSAGGIPATPTSPAVVLGALASSSPGGYETYRGVTLTTTGVVATGFFICDGPCQEGVVAWFDREGRFQGKERAVTADPSTVAPDSFPRHSGVSKFAVASGPSAAVALGRSVLLINPELDAPVQRVPVEAISPNQGRRFMPQTLWSADGTIMVPLSTSITGFDASSLEKRWSWSEGLELYLTHALLTSTGLVLATAESPREGNVRIAAIDVTTGRAAFTLPLPFAVPDESRIEYTSTLLPVPGERLLFLDGDGNRVLIGVADPTETPRVEASDLYPAPGVDVVLSISAAAGAQASSFLVHWEPGDVATVRPGATATHAFSKRGEHEVRVVGLLDGGGTRTAVVTFEVGAQPPPSLSLIQRAFSPENENLTFGILGIVITILGAAFTLGRHRRRFSKLERELAAVEEIRLLSTTRPREAVLALKAYRERLPVDLTSRRIDDAQYGVLDVRSARLLKVLRTRLFSPYDARLTARYHRLVDAAFEDAILQPSEAQVLSGALDQEEGLSAEEKAEVRALLADFTSHHVPFTPRAPT